MKFLLIFTIFLTNLFSLEIINGDVLILKAPKNITGELYLNDKKISWIKNPKNENEMVAILPANYRQNSDLIAKSVKGNQTHTEILKLIKGNYKSETLKVEPAKINPPKQAQIRIKKELDEANKIYSKTEPKYFFNSPFIIPLNSHITSNFGNARVYNGSLKSYHSGVDFRANIGVEIIASNDGIVRIAKDRYYAGGSVVIDHGGGIFSQYYHLSKIFVSANQAVKKGEIIALSGDSGRVTGPHLHFGIAINGVSVNPLSFIQKFNSLVFD